MIPLTLALSPRGRGKGEGVNKKPHISPLFLHEEITG
jgi:hypothetical protein